MFNRLRESNGIASIQESETKNDDFDSLYTMPKSLYHVNLLTLFHPCRPHYITCSHMCCSELYVCIYGKYADEHDLLYNPYITKCITLINIMLYH